MQSYWWRLVPSPAKIYESLVLELPEAWEPANSLGAWRFGPSTRSLGRVFSRDMAGRSKARFYL